MFESFVIVVFESLDCPRCEKMNLRSTVTLESVHICRKCCKTEECAGHEDYSEEPSSV